MTPYLQELPGLLCRSAVVALVATSIIRAWLGSSLFATPRAWLEPLQELDHAPTCEEKTRSKISELLLCPFCLSYHVCFWIMVLFYVPSLIFFMVVCTVLQIVGFHLISDFNRWREGPEEWTNGESPHFTHAAIGYLTSCVGLFPLCFLILFTFRDFVWFGAATLVAAALTQIAQRFLEDREPDVPADVLTPTPAITDVTTPAA